MTNSAHAARGAVAAGIDVGTSKINLVLFSEQKGLIYSCSAALAVPERGSGELLTQRPDDWMATIRSLLSIAGREVDLRQVECVGLSATTPTLVFLDAGDQLLADAVLWCDTHRVGPPGPTNVGFQKLAAILALAPRLRSARQVLDSGNYIAFLLTGERTAGSAAHAQKFAWSPERGYDTTGFDPALVELLPPRVVSTGEEIGRLRAEAADGLGLRRGIPIVGCGYDSVASLPGVGIVGTSDDALLTVGTSVGLYKTVNPQSTADLGPWVPRGHLLPDGAHVVAGGFEAGMRSIGLVHQRLKLTCRAAESDSELEDLAAEMERQESSGCFALPFGGVALRSPLAGRVLPTAVFCDRELVPSDPASLVALRRGVAYFVRYSLDDLAARGVPVTQVRIVGGGTRSPSFCQLVADACGRPAESYGTQAAATGAAILAAAAGGTADDRLRLAGRLAPVAMYGPEQSRRNQYEAGYSLFRHHLEAVVRRSA